uniref:Uncharacterized protein n=1 Tax=Ixodes ricinus TaxID=34613 RepID=A0A6B0UG64_IXORI
MTIMMGCFWTQMPMNLTMLGWSYCFRMRPSCRNFFLCSSGRFTLQVLTATSVLWGCSTALYTSPKFPLPIFSTSSTSSLLSSQRSLKIGFCSIAPDLLVTGSPR